MKTLEQLLDEARIHDPSYWDEKLNIDILKDNESLIEDHIHSLTLYIHQCQMAIEIWSMYKYRLERERIGYQPFTPNSLFEKCCQDEKKIMEEENDGN